MTLLGVSTAALADRNDFEALLAYQPDVIEFYGYPGSALPGIARFCADHGIRPALHTPVPYDLDSPLRRFAPTGPDPRQAAAALALTEATVRCAADLDALHVVVHFPSPYPPFHEAGFEEAGQEFLAATAGLARRYGVPVLVENLSAHPLMRTPEQYHRALAAHRDLGLCLDLGHAHLLGAELGTPLGFASAFGSRVRSMHVYETTAERYPRHGHEPATADRSRADGFIGLAGLLPDLLRLTRPAVLVMEHGPPAPGAPQAKGTAAWLRELIHHHDAGATV
ncbi:sugar phosphate isomerase/epimerase family protein [Streptomyces sp. NBC_01244]|uniref:sugar phosphate isomerase/epimerase family protein n=1 Tax=Streptomyces sp. NBC_01244 TaxID=2903797 RepID=UPI002E128358|nr:sugar phosphate isomerase/epimerase [Streptomyces sp. NBC_01244]